MNDVFPGGSSTLASGHPVAASRGGVFTRGAALLLLTALALIPATTGRAQPFPPNWWKMDDAAFAKAQGAAGISPDPVAQSIAAWMVFARVNQPVTQGGATFRQWEWWPSDEETFAQTKSFDLAKKVRTTPILHAPKTMIKLNGKAVSPHSPLPTAQEEVTRNMLSYNYITSSGLTTSAGVAKYLNAGKAVNLPNGAVEIKALWVISPDNTVGAYPGLTYPVTGAYQVTSGGKTYSLVGFHIMAKFATTPADPFYSSAPSWLWATFELKSNPGLAHAQTFLTVKDQCPPATRTQILTAAGLANGPFANYVCNGTQIGYVDKAGKDVLLGNTTMETFNFNPTGANPAQWTSWQVSCHTCHGTAAANPSVTPTAYYPFSTVNIGKIPAGQMNGYKSLDFVWAISFFAQ